MIDDVVEHSVVCVVMQGECRVAAAPECSPAFNGRYILGKALYQSVKIELFLGRVTVMDFTFDVFLSGDECRFGELFVVA